MLSGQMRSRSRENLLTRLGKMEYGIVGPGSHPLVPCVQPVGQAYLYGFSCSPSSLSGHIRYSLFLKKKFLMENLSTIATVCEKCSVALVLHCSVH